MPSNLPASGGIAGDDVADMVAGPSCVIQASTIVIGGRALAIEGPPGSGKSTLALALIDRGAVLIGDDAVTLTRDGNAIIASPPPNIAGLFEVRGVGLITLPIAAPMPLALVLTLGETPERLPETAPTRDVLGLPVPCLRFDPGDIAPAVRAEWALRVHGLAAS